jgi:hypothetical protein
MPKVAFRHADDIDWQDVKRQRHGDRVVTVRCKILEWTATRVLILTEYDPGLVLEEHGHKSDHMIYVIKGSMTIGGVECRPGSMVLLEHGATFGPIVAGPEGTEFIEMYTGDPRPESRDPDGFERMLGDMGIDPLPDPPFTIPEWS